MRKKYDFHPQDCSTSTSRRCCEPPCKKFAVSKPSNSAPFFHSPLPTPRRGKTPSATHTARADGSSVRSGNDAADVDLASFVREVIHFALFDESDEASAPHRRLRPDIANGEFSPGGTASQRSNLDLTAFMADTLLALLSSGNRTNRTSNIEHRTSNIEHRTSNTQHSRSCGQRLALWRQATTRCEAVSGMLPDWLEPPFFRELHPNARPLFWRRENKPRPAQRKTPCDCERTYNRHMRVAWRCFMRPVFVKNDTASLHPFDCGLQSDPNWDRACEGGSCEPPFDEFRVLPL